MLEKLEREWTSHGSNSMWHSICTNKHTGFSMVIQLENLDIDSSQALGHAVSLLFHANVLPPCSANQTHETPKSLYPMANCFYVNVVSTTFSTQFRAFWQIVHTAICSASSSELLIRISLS